jgi:hypothetical protein
MVAAWWQLNRLGVGAFMPQGTWISPTAKPFVGHRTLTLLDVDYLEVEHAVRNILRHVPPQRGWDVVAIDRMDYIFVGRP